MTYAAQANRPNPAAAIGALGVPAGLAALFIFGLTVTVIVKPKPDNPIGTTVTLPEFEPIPDETTPPETTTSSAQTPTVPVPTPLPPRTDTDFDFDFATDGPITGPIGGDTDMTVGLGPVDFGPPDPRPTAAFDPISAAPRGNPGGWITDNDYRASWINRGYTGVAGFALNIDAGGRVSDCRITSSTGHSALDEATCRLLERRARFTPAKDSSGANVAGTYRSSVNWKIPE